MADKNHSNVLQNYTSQVKVADNSLLRIEQLETGYYNLTNLYTGQFYHIHVIKMQKVQPNLYFHNNVLLQKKRRYLPILPASVEENKELT